MEVLDLLKTSASMWMRDQAPRQAAALAYYTLLAMGPLLLLVIGLAGLLFDQESVRQRILEQLEDLIGQQGAQTAEDLMEARDENGSDVAAIVVGGGALLFAAAGVFRQLRESLNTMWEIKRRRGDGWKEKVKIQVKRNLLGFAGVAALGFLLVATLVVSAVVTAFGERLADLLPGAHVMWQVLNLVLGLVVVGFLFALLFRYLPDAVVAWRDVMVGAAVTAVLFLVGQLLIGVYLGSAATASRYGAAGSVIVLLLWIYFSSLIVLFGAELTQSYANRYGDGIYPNDTGIPLQEAAEAHHDLPWKEGR